MSKKSLDTHFQKLINECEFIDLLSWYTQLTQINNRRVSRIEFNIVDINDNSPSKLLIRLYKDKSDSEPVNKTRLILLNNEDRNPYALDELKRNFLIELINIELIEMLNQTSLLDHKD